MNPKIKNVYLGQAIGDAQGLATEFMTKNQIAQLYPNGIHSYDDIHQMRIDLDGLKVPGQTIQINFCVLKEASKRIMELIFMILQKSLKIGFKTILWELVKRSMKF